MNRWQLAGWQPVNKVFHPALRQLLGYQMRATLERLLNIVRSPKRRWLVLVSVLLGVFWLGQAVVGILLRPAADPEKLKLWIPATMLAYCCWHLVRLLTRTPESPFHWTTAEHELLHGAPLSRTQLIVYRLGSIVIAAIAKSICFSLVMIPDVCSVASAFAGMLCALILIDCLRLMVEIVVYGMTNRERCLCRIGFLGPAVLLFATAVQASLIASNHAMDETFNGVIVVLRAGASLISVLQEEPGNLLMWPFEPLAAAILAPFGSRDFVAGLAIGAMMTACAALAVVVLDKIFQARLAKLEWTSWNFAGTRQEWARGWTGNRWLSGYDGAVVLMQICRWSPVAWRQLLGAWHYRTTVLFSLGIPTVLCCLPLLTNSETMFMQIAGALVFYTFLLLPSALILDYRRDIDRLSVLKSLPMSPLAITIGQLAAPVILAGMFQGLVLSIAVITGNVSAFQGIACWILLIPFNVLNFALENYLFLVSPYRRDAEGMMVFVRTILTFTAKGVLFGMAFAITIAWALLSVKIAEAWSLPTWLGHLLFMGGLWLLVSAASIMTVGALRRRFESFDVTIDTPANV